MKELELPEGVIFPKVQPACSAICRNALNQICIEKCTPRRDCSSFELRDDIGILDMPMYPDNSNLTWKERFVLQEAYTKKTVDFIQGRKAQSDDYPSNFPGRSLPDSEGHQGNSEMLTGYSVQPDASDGTLQVRETTPSTEFGLSEVDKGTK